MKKNTLVIEPASAHRMLIHTPYRLPVSPVNQPQTSHPEVINADTTWSGVVIDDVLVGPVSVDVLARLRQYDDFDNAETFVVSEYCLQLSIPLTRKPTKALYWALMVIVAEMQLENISDLRIKYSSEVSRELDHLLSNILKKLARGQWAEDREHDVEDAEDHLKHLSDEADAMYKAGLKLTARIDAIDERRPKQERELTLALRAFDRAHRGAFQPERILKAATRWNVARAMVDADPEDREELAGRRIDLGNELRDLIQLRDQADRKVEKLKAQKCLNFSVESGTKNGKVTLRVTGA